MADILISELQELDALSGKEQIPVELDGKNYKITPDQIKTILQEEISKTYREFPISTYPQTNGNFENNTWEVSSVYKSLMIPRNEFEAKELRFSASSWKISFAFLKSLPVKSKDSPDLCNNTSRYSYPAVAQITMNIPEDCEYVYIYISQGDSFDVISVEEVFPAVENRVIVKDTSNIFSLQLEVNDLETRVHTLEHSPAPANISVSREEFDELKRELDSLKAQNTAVAGKETI